MKLNRLFQTATLFIVLILIGTACAAQAPADGKDESIPMNSQNLKTLVVYFSHSGNTKIVAQEIAAELGADVFQIETTNAYPKDYKATVDLARKEQDQNARPKLKRVPENIGSYDVVFVGSSNWWGTFPMGMFTLLESVNLAGKIVVPFCTHEGSGLGRIPSDVAKFAPKSRMLSGLAIRGGSAANSKREINNWLKGLKITK
ncbi:MAG: flavodoxin [Cloacibacillus sp.]